MSTSDQQGPLTRKQLRELRLTGATPIISQEDADAAAESAASPAPPLPTETTADSTTDSVDSPSDEDHAGPQEEEHAGPQDAAVPGAPLTRRQARAQERVRTASVPVIESDPSAQPDAESAGAEQSDDDVVELEVVELEVIEEPSAEGDSPLVSGVPDFARTSTADDDEDDIVDDVVFIEPISATGSADAPQEAVIEPEPAVGEAQGTAASDDVDALGLAAESADSDDVLADVDETDEDDAAERPVVNPAFGSGLLDDAAAPKPFTPSFDDLLAVSDSTGSQHLSPNALIFTPSAGEGSLSGPVASTGEILVTGSYELPRGIGSQGHAHGTTDGKDIDAVLIDGELPPASSPTPIAASSAVSTIKPAGEVIRPPAPEKGNKLMIILAIVAGGLALVVATGVIIAITTNVF